MKISSSMKPGDVIGGKYRLIQQIGEGEGNMGAVWSGTCMTLDKPVALKFVLHSTHDLRQRLLREATACASLSHPNIVKLYDVGETDDGDPFLVLELLTGQTLGRMIKSKRRIEPPIAARIARDIASALDAAHKAKFVHRDLKPANVFLHRASGMEDGEFLVKVLDFGVSKHIGANDGLVTATGAAVGSPAYMSPEQVCVRKDVDHRTDIWSFGVVLYEMLTGVRPFEGAVDQVVRNILLAEIVPPSSRVRSLPPEYDEIVNRCLERDRGKRISHAEDLVRMLAPLIETSRSSRVQLNVPGLSVETAQEVASSTLHSTPAPGSLAARTSDSGTPAVGMSTVAEAPERRKTPLPSMAEKPQFTTTGTQLLPKSTAAAILSGKSAVSATGTAILDPEADVGDPFAALRQERQQALAAYRQTLVLPDTIVQGGTMALSADVLEKATSGVTLNETHAGLPSESVNMASAKVNGQGHPRRPKRGGRVIFASIAIGVIAALSLVGVLLASSLSREKEALGAAETRPTMQQASLPAATAEAAASDATTSEGALPIAESEQPTTAPATTQASKTIAEGPANKSPQAHKQSSGERNRAPSRSAGGKHSASIVANPYDTPATTRARLFD
ncbi:MAG: serine/threonine protein kinase [Polyangiaceae bacterium]|nr:serine/threonine protein kinase [Polyangiaceae bacterium]